MLCLEMRDTGFYSHGEGFASKMRRLGLFAGGKVGRLVVFWRAVMVGKLHEQEALHVTSISCPQTLPTEPRLINCTVSEDE